MRENRIVFFVLLISILPINVHSQWDKEIHSFFEKKIVIKYYGGGKDVIKLKKYHIKLEPESDAEGFYGYAIKSLNADDFKSIKSSETRQNALNSSSIEYSYDISKIGRGKKDVTLLFLSPFYFQDATYAFFVIQVYNIEHFVAFRYDENTKKLSSDIISLSR